MSLRQWLTVRSTALRGIVLILSLPVHAATVPDDRPIVTSPPQEYSDEADLGPIVETGQIFVDFGNDAPGTLGPDGQFAAQGSLLGGTLTSHGIPVAVLVTTDGYVGNAGITEIFRLVIDQYTGEYVFTLYRPLDHADGNDPNDILSLYFGIIARDSDGDSATTTITVRIADDAPQATNANGAVAESNLPPAVAMGTVAIDYGKDNAGGVGPNGIFNATGSLAGGSLSSLGVPVLVTPTPVGYVGTAGPETVFELTIDSSSGDFDFSLSRALDHADRTDPNDVIQLVFGVVASDFDTDSTATTITIEVEDDGDSAGFTIVESGGDTSVSEGGTSDTFTVVLDSPPVNDVVINVSSGDTGEATVDKASLTFTSTNWNTPQTVTVTGVDDVFVDGTQTTPVTLTIDDANSDDSYDPLDNQTVSITTTDNDIAGLTLIISAPSVSESAGVGATTATVIRNTDTTNPLTVNLASDDTSEATVPATVTIAAGQATSPAININAVDDAIVDGTQTVTMTASAAGHASDTDTLDVTDNDTATLTLTISAASVSEGAGVGATTGTVSRNTDTTNPLTVNLTSDDTSEATVPAMVTIAAGQATSAAFNIDAVDDAIVDGTQTATVTATAAGHANGTDTLDVTDDDTAALTVAIAAASVSEAAGAGATTATVSRNTDTTNLLTVNLTSDDTSEAAVPATVTIAAGQSTSPAFNIDAVDDAMVDGTQTVTVTATEASHANGTDTLDVNDDDAPGFTVTETGGNTEVGESGTTDTFTVVLDAQPMTDVVIDVTSADTGEATVDQASLTFTNGDWDKPQTVTVTGVDDSATDGNQTTSVTVSVNDVGSDDVFDPLADQTVSVTTVDDEVRTFTGPTATGTGDATLTITGSSCALDLPQTAFIPTDGLVLPPGVDYPHGAVRFRIIGCEPGTTVEVTLSWPDAITDAEGWKLDATADPFPIPDAMVEGNTYRYSITDGGALDGDGLVDGNMDDPSAPGVADAGGAPVGPPVKEIPTLDEWARWLLIGLLALLGLGLLGQRRRL